MTQQELADYIFDTYSIQPEHPFPMDDVSCVFRHIDNRKWFALTMNIPYSTLGIKKDGRVDILNIKLDPILIGSLRSRPGFRPAYHMNKDKWLTVLLDGTARREEIEALLAMSYDLTGSKTRSSQTGKTLSSPRRASYAKDNRPNQTINRLWKQQEL